LRTLVALRGSALSRVPPPDRAQRVRRQQRTGARCGSPHDQDRIRLAWSDKAAYQDKAKKVAALFRESFKKYEAQASAEVRAGGPKL
jgi:hypothetical protein